MNQMNPKTTALILVGFQNDYFAANGILRGVIEEPDRVDSVLARSLEFIREVASTELTVISTPIVLELEYRELANAVGILDTIKASGAFKLGTQGAETIPEVLAFGDRVTYVMGKVGFNAFSNTDLENVLAEKGIKDVLVAGMVTSLCIDSTGRAAYERGFRVSILSDCCSARTRAEQDFFCQNIFPLYGGVLDNHQALNLLAPAQVSDGSSSPGMDAPFQTAGKQPAVDLHVEATYRLTEALVESENRMRRRLDLLTEVVFETDSSGSLVFLNQAWIHTLGYATDAAIGRSLAGFVLAEDQRLYAQIMAGEAVTAAARPVIRLRRADGGYAWMEMSVTRLHTGGVVGAFHDVTARKRADEELAKLSLVASYTENLVVITDRHGLTEWVNRAFFDLTGYGLEDMLGRKPGSLLQGPESDQAAVVQISKSLREGRSFKTELLNYKRSGEPYWVSMQITPIRGADGAVEHYIAVQTDSTELHRTAKELEVAKEYAESANEAKNQFLATISHEMRTPLSVILGSTELALDPATELESLMSHLRRIDANAKLLLRLISGMLDVSKIEAGQIDFERVPFQLHACMSATLAPLAEKAATLGLDFTFVFDEALPAQVMGDPDRLRQIVTNLGENAVKFTDSGSVRIQATRLRQEDRGGDWLEIRFIDTGCGISREVQTRIFGRFEQADSSTTRRKGGVGLGLNIVKALVEGLGGQVSVRSSPGEGADFRVLLPIEPVADAVRQEVPLSQQTARIAAEGPARDTSKPFRILIAEDSDANYAITEIFLKRAGYCVTRAINGRFAVAAAAGVDLILMDIEMPEMDGLEAIRQIREAERLASRQPLPILVLSAHAVASYRELCFEAGCSGFLTKPIRNGCLCAAVRDALENRQGVGNSSSGSSENTGR